MRSFFMRRLMQIIPVLLIIILIVFTLVYLAGDPVALMLPADATEEDVETLRKALKLDRPYIVQLGAYIGHLLTGDFGTSFHYNEPALPLVLERLPATIELALAAMIVAILISIPLGIWSAMKRNSTVDVAITGTSVLGAAIPNFWLGIMLILIFAVNYKWFPVSGRGSLAHLVLPAITLGTGLAATIARLMRSSLLDVLSQDYIRTAKAKGIRQWPIIFVHSLRNALIPVVTMIALQAGGLMGGALVTEYIFAWPGIGQLLIQSIHVRDMSVIQAATFMIALIVIGLNLFADIMYRWLDPRITFDERSM
ncbi:MAG TPA: ABC transporter permease [Bacillota bacterium]|nr:ABC transporter permease [Bacillota bacterium]